MPASFRGALFHVETSSRGGGRRTVVHQYPKRNIPYSEDMGREAIKWQFTGYLILRDKGFPGNLMTQIADLINALDADDAGMLVHPILGDMLVMCDKYSYSDKRTQGGFVEFDMSFVEAGGPALSQSFVDATSNLQQSAGEAENAGVLSIGAATASPGAQPGFRA